MMVQMDAARGQLWKAWTDRRSGSTGSVDRVALCRPTKLSTRASTPVASFLIGCYAPDAWMPQSAGFRPHHPPVDFEASRPRGCYSRLRLGHHSAVTATYFMHQAFSLAL